MVDHELSLGMHGGETGWKEPGAMILWDAIRVQYFLLLDFSKTREEETFIMFKTLLLRVSLFLKVEPYLYQY